MPNYPKPMEELINDFKEDYEKFAEIFDDKAIERAIGMTDKMFDPEVWGEYEKYSFYRDGWFLLVAHTLFTALAAHQSIDLGAMPSSMRGIDSVTVDDEHTVFGSQIMLKLQPWDDEYASSVYGVHFLELRAIVAVGGFGFYG